MTKKVKIKKVKSKIKIIRELNKGEEKTEESNRQENSVQGDWDFSSLKVQKVLGSNGRDSVPKRQEPESFDSVQRKARAEDKSLDNFNNYGTAQQLQKNFLKRIDVRNATILNERDLMLTNSIINTQHRLALQENSTKYYSVGETIKKTNTKRYWE